MSDDDLIAALLQEAIRAGSWKIEFSLNLTQCLELAGNLQLAFRHPENHGPSSQAMRMLLTNLKKGLKGGGFPAHVEAIERGDQPVYDVAPDVSKT